MQKQGLDGYNIRNKKTLSKKKKSQETMKDILIKGSINQEYIAIINTYVSNNRAPKYMKQTERTKEIHSSTIVVGDFNTSLSMMNRTFTQQNNNTEGLNNTINQLDLTEICRTVHYRPYTRPRNKSQPI